MTDAPPSATSQGRIEQQGSPVNQTTPLAFEDSERTMASNSEPVFEKETKDPSIAPSHHPDDPMLVVHSDREKPLPHFAESEAGDDDGDRGEDDYFEEHNGGRSARHSVSSAIAKVSTRLKRFSLRIDTPDASADAHEDSTPHWLRSKEHQSRAIPKSSYYVGPPGMNSAFGTDPVGEIGVHHPREIIRVERDYSAGELPQFHPTYPLELEGRITPTQFQETINDINEILISANDLRKSTIENVVAAFTLYLSMLVTTSHYDKEMQRLEALIDHKNATLYQPQGLRILWPRKTAFLFLEIEYY